jgi:N-acetylmuramoyl-L-alanine amidase
MMSWDEFDKYCAALCAWREASDQGRDGIRGVIHVIANRALARNRSWAKVVFEYLQFSSITAPGDQQIKAGRVPVSPDAIFVECYEIAGTIRGGGDFDLTNGATHYFNPHVVMPDWAAAFVKTGSIGQHDFYRDDHYGK